MKARGKTFLNESYDENGHVKWEVKSGKDVYYRGEFISGGITIADCHNSITLDLCCETATQVDKRIDKVNVLIAELMNTRKALEDAKADLSKKVKYYY